MVSIKEKYKKALVTGGAGFIGSHLVTGLLKEGIDVVSIDDYSAGKEENLSHVEKSQNLSIVKCDITDYSSLSNHFDGVDIVFHLACSKNTICMKDPNRDLAINAEGTLNLLHQAKKHGVNRFIHASTGSVYGEPKVFPTDEQHILDPVSYYGVSKLCGEKYVRLFSDLYGMDTVILRYFHVFGPRQEYSDVGGVVSIFARRAVEGKPLIIYGDGSQLRSFTYVEDLVRINCLVASLDGISGEAFNCASGVKITIKQLAEQILNDMDMNELQIKYEDWKLGDIRKFDVDNNKLRSLGFEFKYDFNTGLKETLNWSKKYFSNFSAKE